MRMGSYSGIAGVMLLVLFFPLTLSAQALPASQPAPISPVHSANDPHFSRSVQAANDAHFLNASRAQAATVAAEQSGLGKIMSRIFSQRALASGLRGTPQFIAIGLALDALMSYFLSEEGSPPDAVLNPGFNESLRNRTWGIAALDKGILEPSHLLSTGEKLEFVHGVKNVLGTNVVNTSDGAYVYGKNGPFYPEFLSAKPFPVIIPNKPEPFIFTPRTYELHSFSLPAGVHVSDSFADRGKYKFKTRAGNQEISGNDLVDVVATAFYYKVKLGLILRDKISSFSPIDYDTPRDTDVISGYPVYPNVSVRYKHNPYQSTFDHRMIDQSYAEFESQLDNAYAFSISPKVLNDEAAVLLEKNDDELSPSLVQTMVNNALIRVASSTDYQGIPFSTSTPVTAEEIQQAANEAAVPLDLLPNSKISVLVLVIN